MQTSSEYLLQFLKRKKQSSDDAFVPNDSNPILNEAKTVDANEATSCDDIDIHTLFQGASCLHQVALPSQQKEMPSLKSITAEDKLVQYPFVLDEFQERAILCIHHRQSVLVAAHTSAGKTVVAEYAIARALKDKQRVIYTTPIKALSNQKYNEFGLKYGCSEVGLMTGDVTENVEANIIIMTTEILRLMIYRGSSVTREVGWVIFDEVHYMRDPSRGHVWEETISLLSPNVHQVFLSATIPNASEFARWIVSLNMDENHSPVSSHFSSNCHIVYTEFRPTPLQHYLCLANGLNQDDNENFELVVNEAREFLKDSFDNFVQKLETSANTNEMVKSVGHDTSSLENESVEQAVNAILEQELCPLIIFTFSKQRAEEIAWHLRRKKVRLTNKAEKFVNEAFYEKIINDYLPPEDRSLPQVEEMVKLLAVGIGVHHSGLLPIVKEAVELFFSEGFIKILIATETFAMGLNMPARCCLFNGIKKFDGVTSRWLTPGEYIQMSGRAGRRGKDTRGTVVLMVNANSGTPPPKQVLQNLLTGQAETLNSSFRVTYHMILNLMRLEQMHVETVMRRSFYQYQRWHSLLPSVKEEYEKVVRELSTLELEVNDEKQVGRYLSACQQWDKTQLEMWTLLLKYRDCCQLMQSGVVIRVREYNWCVIIESECNFSPQTGDGTRATLRCLVPCEYSNDNVSTYFKSDKKRRKVHGNHGNGMSMADEEDSLHWECFTFQESDILAVSKVKVSLQTPTANQTSPLTYESLLRSPHKKDRQFLQPVWRDTLNAACSNTVSPLAAFKAIQHSNKSHLLTKMKELYQVCKKIEQDLCETTSGLCDNVEQCILSPPEDIRRGIRQYRHYHNKRVLRDLLIEVLHQKRLLQQDDVILKQDVLQRMAYCEPSRGIHNESANYVISLKGRVACELAAAEGLDAILLTELLFDNFFHALKPEECVSVLSCFTFEEGGKSSNLQNNEPGKNKKKSKAMSVKGSDVVEEKLIQRLDALYKAVIDKAKEVERMTHLSENSLASSSKLQPFLASLLERHSPSTDQMAKLPYAQRFNPGLMWLSLEWAKGREFSFLMRIATKQLSENLHEGAIIRSMRRLRELLEQMQVAAQVISNQPLEEKFQAGSKSIYRAIAFGKSLWSELNVPASSSDTALSKS